MQARSRHLSKEAAAVEARQGKGTQRGAFYLPLGLPLTRGHSQACRRHSVSWLGDLYFNKLLFSYPWFYFGAVCFGFLPVEGMLSEIDQTLKEYGFVPRQENAVSL